MGKLRETVWQCWGFGKMQLSATDATAPAATAQLPGWAVEARLPARAKAIDIAKARGLNKGTVSRYLSKHPELRGADNLVDVVAFDRHYGTNPAVISSAIGAATRQPEQGELPVEELREKGNADAEAIAKERRRQEEIKTITAEMDLAERQGRSVGIEEVTASRAAIAVTLRDKLLNIDIAFAERLIAEVREGADARRVQTMITESHRTLLHEVVEELEKEVTPGEVTANAA